MRGLWRRPLVYFGRRRRGREHGEDLLVCEWTESESHSAHFQRFGDLDLLGASLLRSLGLGQTWDGGISFFCCSPLRLRPQEHIADQVCRLQHGEEHRPPCPAEAPRLPLGAAQAPRLDTQGSLLCRPVLLLATRTVAHCSLVLFYLLAFAQPVPQPDRPFPLHAFPPGVLTKLIVPELINLAPHSCAPRLLKELYYLYVCLHVCSLCRPVSSRTPRAYLIHVCVQHMEDP